MSNNGIGDFQIELCLASAGHAALANEFPVSRIELCSALGIGGVTPSYGLMQKAKKAAPNVEIHPIIRPRGGDFLYSSSEIEVMLEDIRIAKESGMNGVVFGVLTPDAHVDSSIMQELKDAAFPLDCTCHRAIDMTQNPIDSLLMLIRLGFKRVLSSGASINVTEGLSVLKQMVDTSENRIQIMAGSGVNARSTTILKEIGIRHFHFSCTKIVPSEMKWKNEKVEMGTTSESEFDKAVFDFEKLMGVVGALEHV